MNINLEELRSYADKGLLESFILSQGLLPMQVLELLIKADNITINELEDTIEGLESELEEANERADNYEYQCGEERVDKELYQRMCNDLENELHYERMK